MNCPKCQIKLHNSFSEDDEEWVEMENKGEVGKQEIEVDENGTHRETTKRLYQCPVCKEIIIQ